MERLMRAVFVFAALVVAAGIFGQEFRSAILGRITDSSGGAVGDAKVVATNTETGASYRTASTKDGAYALPALPPGHYRLEVEFPGFRKYVREGITLQLQERPIIDIALEVGEVSSNVTVSADAGRVETSTASRGEVITGRTVVDMPLNGRNPMSLAALTSGVNFTTRGLANTFFRTTSNNGITSIVMSGGQASSNESMLDGVPNTGSNGLIEYVPSVDATQEFKVQTNVFDASFGRFTGGMINTIIRSGTNQLHGTLFEFCRNSDFNARDPFATSIPRFGYNLFGGSVGGPVYLPKVYHGKNRTFFFFNFEGSREGVPRADVSTVPTDLQRRGDFSKTNVRLASGAGAPVTIYDPSTTRLAGTAYVRDPFPGNVIPANRFDPIAKNVLPLYPMPNAPGDSINGANNYLLSFEDPVFDNGYVIKIDQNFSDRHHFFARYSWRHFHVGRQGAFKNYVTGDAEDRRTPGVAIDDSYTLNPTTVLDFRYGYSRYGDQQQADSYGYDVASLGFSPSYARQIIAPAIPEFQISGMTTLSAPTKWTNSAEDTHSIRGSVTKVRGRLTMNFGAEGRLLRNDNNTLSNSAAGLFTFDSAFTRGPNPQVASTTGGAGLASFLLGLGSGGQVAYNVASADQGTYYGFFTQNDLRLTTRLTLNFGLRYEWEGPYTERYNHLNRGFDFNVDSPIAAQAQTNYAASPIPQVPASQFQVRGGLLFAGVGGQPRGLTNVDYNNIAPRVGAAYAINSKTAVRAGFGFFYGPTTLLSITRQGFSTTTPFVGTINGSLTAVNTLANPFPDGLQTPPGASQGLLTYVGQSASYVDVGRQQPLNRQYQFSIQRELPGGMLAEAAYSGSSSVDLPVTHQLDGTPADIHAAAQQTFLQTGRNILSDSVANPFYGLITTGSLNGKTTTRGQLVRAYPQFTGLTVDDESIGTSRYDSAQFKLNKRFSAGLSFLVSYDIAKQLDRTSYLNDQDTTLVKELDVNDIPQHFVVSGTYELPFGPGKRFLGQGKGFAGKVLGGWQINGVYTAESGIPINISGGESFGRSAKISDPTVNHWFDTSAFRQRQTLELVSTSRLPDVRAAGMNDIDFSVFKNTALAEHFTLQFRAEAFNMFNHPEWSSPNASFTSPNFAQVTSINIYPRQLQFGLKLLW